MTAASVLWENGPGRVVMRGQAGLVTPRGDPVPPQDVVQRLTEYNQQRGTRLSISWVPGAWGCAYFGLFDGWKQGDKRWERVQVGETEEANARDLVTMFPKECSPAEMMAWVETRYGRTVADPRAEADRLVAEAMRLRAQADEDAMNVAVETGTRRILDESDHLRQVRAGAERPHPMVHGTEFTEPAEPKRLLDKPFTSTVPTP